MGDHVPDGSDECATDPALTAQDRRWRRGSGGVRPADKGSEALVGGVLVPPDDVSADHTALGSRPRADPLAALGRQVRRVVVTDDRDAYVRRAQRAQVAAEFQELAAVLLVFLMWP